MNLDSDDIKRLGYQIVGQKANVMPNKYYMTHLEVVQRARATMHSIYAAIPQFGANGQPRIFAVPRGGVPAAYLVISCLLAADDGIHPILVDDWMRADVIIDDIIDSGATKAKFPGKPFFALVDKQQQDKDLGWVVFPWEVTLNGDDDEGVEDNIRRLLQWVGEDPNREGLLETPKRVAKAWKHWCQGYHQDPAEVLKTFEDGAEKTDEMVIVRNIELYSHCEHHMAPFFGVAHIAYIPDKRIVGLSKLARVADIFAQRLQVQERLTNQIADCINDTLEPLGVGVVIEAKHFCMCSRGVNKQGSTTITSALRGAIKDKPAARAEFLSLTKP